MTIKLKSGDTVVMLRGKDRTKTGKILRVLKGEHGSRLMIEGLNLVVKHLKPRRQGQKGERVKIPAAVPVGSVKLICKACKKATRVGFRISGDVKKRICKKCASFLD